VDARPGGKKRGKSKREKKKRVAPNATSQGGTARNNANVVQRDGGERGEAIVNNFANKKKRTGKKARRFNKSQRRLDVKRNWIFATISASKCLGEGERRKRPAPRGLGEKSERKASERTRPRKKTSPDEKKKRRPANRKRDDLPVGKATPTIDDGHILVRERAERKKKEGLVVPTGPGAKGKSERGVAGHVKKKRSRFVRMPREKTWMRTHDKTCFVRQKNAVADEKIDVNRSKEEETSAHHGATEKFELRFEKGRFTIRLNLKAERQSRKTDRESEKRKKKETTGRKRREPGRVATGGMRSTAYRRARGTS